MPATSTDRLNGLTASLALKAPVRAVTSANITLSGLQTVGGVVLAEDDRVLVLAQTSSVDNGIYNASTSDWTRAADFDGARDAVQGTLVVTDGVSTALLFYRLTTANPVVFGTSSITFEPASEVQDPWPQTQSEIDDGIIPLSTGYPPGDPRRHHVITVTDDEIKGLYCDGFVPTYVDSNTFTVAGDATAVFGARTRLAVFSATERKYGQVLSTSYSAPNTTIEMTMEIGNLPTSPLAVLKYVSPQLAHMNTFMVDYNVGPTMQIINKNTGAAASTHVLIGDFDASGVVIVATKSTTLPTPYLSLAPNNPCSFIHTGTAIPIVIATHDRARLIIDGDGLSSQFSTSLLVQQTLENPNGSDTSVVDIDGTGRGTCRISVASVDQAEFSASATDCYLATVVASPLRLMTNNVARLTITAAGIGDYANDAAAAAGGVPVTGIYRNGSVLMIRVA